MKVAVFVALIVVLAVSISAQPGPPRHFRGGRPHGPPDFGGPRHFDGPRRFDGPMGFDGFGHHYRRPPVFESEEINSSEELEGPQGVDSSEELSGPGGLRPGQYEQSSSSEENGLDQGGRHEFLVYPVIFIWFSVSLVASNTIRTKTVVFC